MSGNLVYIQSGGPTSVINTSLYGAIMKAKSSPEIDHIYGSRYGIEGLIKDNLVDLGQYSDDELALLKQTPGAALGSSRKKISGDQEYLQKILETIEKRNIKYVLVNGGNDSMDTCAALAKLTHGKDIRIIGVPKTIDNDLDFTHHCVGYPSACRHILNAVSSIIVDGSSYSKGKVTIIEVMGRDTGWLAASTGLLEGKYRPDAILLPETKNIQIRDFCEHISKVYKEKGTAFVVVSEGVELQREEVTGADAFGHTSPEGVSISLAKTMKNEYGINCRYAILSIPTRADPYSISKVDSKEAYEVGQKAVELALSGESGLMVAIKNGAEEGYFPTLFTIEADKVANKVKFFPSHWYSFPNIVSEEFKNYLSPLLRGSIEVELDSNGVSKKFELKN